MRCYVAIERFICTHLLLHFGLRLATPLFFVVFPFVFLLKSKDVVIGKNLDLA
jgi:hypothetical protein